MKKPEVLIVGGARTPMADYVRRAEGRVGAGARGDRRSRRTSEDRRQTGVDRPRGDRQRPSNQRGCDLRCTARRPEGGPARRRPGADGEPALRVGHSGSRQRRADDSTRRSGRRADRRGREHEPGAARHSAASAAVSSWDRGKLEDSLWDALLDTHCGCTMAATAENCAVKLRRVAAGAGTGYALRSQQLADKAWREGRFADEVVPVEIEDAKRRANGQPRRSHASGDDDWRSWPHCRRPSRRTAA